MCTANCPAAGALLMKPPQSPSSCKDGTCDERSAPAASPTLIPSAARIGHEFAHSPAGLQCEPDSNAQLRGSLELELPLKADASAQFGVGTSALGSSSDGHSAGVSAQLGASAPAPRLSPDGHSAGDSAQLGAGTSAPRSSRDEHPANTSAQLGADSLGITAGSTLDKPISAKPMEFVGDSCILINDEHTHLNNGGAPTDPDLQPIEVSTDSVEVLAPSLSAYPAAALAALPAAGHAAIGIGVALAALLGPSLALAALGVGGREVTFTCDISFVA